MKKYALLALLTGVLLSGCSSQTSVATSSDNIKQEESLEVITQAVETSVEEGTTELIEKEPEVYTVSICAVGDNLYHSTVYNKGVTDSGYDFDFVYDNVRDFISSFDIAVVNQETVFVDNDKVSSYPCFGTPKAAGEALINAGFDVFLGATNHTYDKGKEGIESTLDFYKGHPEVYYLGINSDEEEYNTVKIIEKNNIKIAMLNYTYGLNGFVIPDDSYYLVDTLYNEEKVKQDLQYAEENADITIVFPHWGTEYVYDETDYQKQWANLFTEYGADIIIGTHPHVVEPVKYITSENGNKSLCYYSLGNFVSGQDEKPRILGGIACFKIEKNEGVVTIKDCTFTPSVTFRSPNSVGVYLLKDFTNELANSSSLKASPDYLMGLWTSINEKSEITY